MQYMASWRMRCRRACQGNFSWLVFCADGGRRWWREWHLFFDVFRIRLKSLRRWKNGTCLPAHDNSNGNDDGNKTFYGAVLEVRWWRNMWIDLNINIRGVGLVCCGCERILWCYGIKVAEIAQFCITRWWWTCCFEALLRSYCCPLNVGRRARVESLNWTVSLSNSVCVAVSIAAYLTVYSLSHAAVTQLRNERYQHTFNARGTAAWF